MKGISIQERYDEISEMTGLSEEVIRTVLKATRKSIVNSILKGDRATVPGLVTFVPNVKNKLLVGGEVKSYLYVKATASPSLETDIKKVSEFCGGDYDEEDMQELKLNIVENDKSPRYNPKSNGIITKQINALL